MALLDDALPGSPALRSKGMLASTTTAAKVSASRREIRLQ
jgi:hypothetical protein